MITICFDRSHKPGTTPARVPPSGIHARLRSIRKSRRPAPQPAAPAQLSPTVQGIADRLEVFERTRPDVIAMVGRTLDVLLAQITSTMDKASRDLR